ncbi:hypothetical protein [Ursidibacter sp. B-7004-1]
MKKCTNEDQVIDILREYVEEGELGKDECFILGWLYTQEERQNNKNKHTKRTNQKGFVMNY